MRLRYPWLLLYAFVRVPALLGGGMYAFLRVPSLLGGGMYAFLRVLAFLGGGVYAFLRVPALLGGGMYVFYVSRRSWMAGCMHFYISWRSWVADLYINTCVPEGLCKNRHFITCVPRKARAPPAASCVSVRILGCLLLSVRTCILTHVFSH